MLEQALQLGDLGYAVFPCQVGGKRPLTAHGLLDATVVGSQIEDWWTETPAANVAIRTDGLLIVDIDGADNPWLADQPERLMDLAAGVLSLTPRGGRHYIFQQPAGRQFRNTAGKLAKAVDTRADGGYILVPPSVVDGKLYRWATEALDCSPTGLPEPPKWLIDLLDTSSNLASIRGDVTEPGNAIPSGQRNGTLTSLGGTMRRVGMSQAEILAALKTANRERCRPPMPDDEVELIAWSVSRYEPDQNAVAVAERHAEQDGLMAKPLAIGPFPDELLRVPGFISQVCDYNLNGAFKPQPVLALAGALSLLATLTGRKVTDPFGTRTNLYCLGVGESGCGKERARQVNKEILYMAGLDKLIGPEGLASHAGLVNAVERSPEVLFQLDEIGRLLKTLGNASQSPHLYNIATVLMKLFTSSNSVYVGDAYADTERNKTIVNPHACLYGTTVPKSLYEGLTSDSLTDGFLSRMLIFESAEADPEPQIAMTGSPPDGLIKLARHWGELRPGGNLAGQNPVPRIVPYTQDASMAIASLEALARRERKDAESTTATMWTRTTEKARKLALLWACSVSHIDPCVTADAAWWASSVSEYLTRKMLSLAEANVADNPFEAQQKRILREIAKTGSLTQSQLYRVTRSMKIRERDEIMQNLIITGQVVVETVETTGRARTVYRIH